MLQVLVLDPVGAAEFQSYLQHAGAAGAQVQGQLSSHVRHVWIIVCSLLYRNACLYTSQKMFWKSNFRDINVLVIIKLSAYLFPISIDPCGDPSEHKFRAEFLQPAQRISAYTLRDLAVLCPLHPGPAARGASLAEDSLFIC